MADPLILDINKPYILKYRPKARPYPRQVIAMMKPATQEKYVSIPEPVPDPIVHSDDDEEQEFDWNAATTPDLPSLMESLDAGIGMGDDDDDDTIMITGDPEPENNENSDENEVESPAKRQRIH